MSPITRLVPASRRAFSVLPRIRSAVRNFEPHPFERYAKTQQPAAADWGRQVRKIGGNAVFFFPGFALVLGWPLLAEKLVGMNL